MTASLPDLLLALPGWAVLLAVFLLPALESSAFIGFVFPGEIAVILGGVAAAAGRMPLPAMIVAAVLGAVIGDSIGYAVGKRWGDQILHGTIGKLPIVRHELGKHLESAKAFVRKRGPHAVFIGRFTAALRVLVPSPTRRSCSTTCSGRSCGGRGSRSSGMWRRTPGSRWPPMRVTPASRCSR